MHRVNCSTGSSGTEPSGRMPTCPLMNSIRLSPLTSIWCTYRPTGAWMVSGFRACFIGAS